MAESAAQPAASGQAERRTCVDVVEAYYSLAPALAFTHYRPPGGAEGATHPVAGRSSMSGSRACDRRVSTFGVYGSAERRGQSRVQYSLYFHILHMYMIHM